MTKNAPKFSRNSMRRFLIAAGVLLLGILLVWVEREAVIREPSTPVAKATPKALLHPAHRKIAPSAILTPSTSYQLSGQKILKYGRAEGEIGMVSGKDAAQVGPEAFSVGKDGGILVADVVNHRVMAYARDGTYRRSIDLPEIAIGDVTSDGQSRVYVYDQVRHSLHQFDASGAAQSALDLNPADLDTRGYFHVANNSVYFADAAARDVLVATLQDGLLVSATGNLSGRTTDGIHAESGRIYGLSVVKGQTLRLQVDDTIAPAAPGNIEVSMPGILAARYAGEDESRRFYVQTERLDGKKVVLEVLAFSPVGEELGATRMPENNYAIWTAKLVDVGSDGTIVQFLPQQDQAKLSLFTN